MDRNLIGLDVVLDPANVALLAEGVDRNFHGGKVELVCVSSPSSRRAWIEIVRVNNMVRVQRVALLAEGVDRNPLFGWIHAEVCGRPPRGGRG